MKDVKDYYEERPIGGASGSFFGPDGAAGKGSPDTEVVKQYHSGSRRAPAPTVTARTHACGSVSVRYAPTGEAYWWPADKADMAFEWAQSRKKHAAQLGL